MKKVLLAVFLLLLFVAPLSHTYGIERGNTVERKIQVPTENSVFKNIQVSGNSGNYFIEGMVNSKIGHFYYTVEDGHKEFITERKVIVEKNDAAWEPFLIEINILKEELPSNGTLILNLYESEKNSMTGFEQPVILEKFYPVS